MYTCTLREVSVNSPCLTRQVAVFCSDVLSRTRVVDEAVDQGLSTYLMSWSGQARD